MIDYIVYYLVLYLCTGLVTFMLWNVFLVAYGGEGTTTARDYYWLVLGWPYHWLVVIWALLRGWS